MVHIKIIIGSALPKEHLTSATDLFMSAFLPLCDHTKPKSYHTKRLRDYFKNLQHTISSNRGTSLLFLDGDTYAAFLCMVVYKDNPTRTKYVHIPEVCVNPLCQGKGFGDMLISKALEIANDKYLDCDWIDLNTQECNNKAQGLYKKHGFETMMSTCNMLEYSVTPDGKKCASLRMARPLHTDRPSTRYPFTKQDTVFDEGYLYEATYPVKRYAKYTKDLYGQMIRFQYGIYEDDPSLSKQEVNEHAKHDASLLLSQQEQHPKDFIVYCAVTEVSIAGYIILSRMNGIWTFTMDHYYDTDRYVLEKLVKEGIKLADVNVDEDIIFNTMMDNDKLRGESKTKYRSMYTLGQSNPTAIPDSIKNGEEIDNSEEPEKLPEEEPTTEETPENDKVEVVPEEPEEPKSIVPEAGQTEVPYSQPLQPKLKGWDDYVKSQQNKMQSMASKAVSEPMPWEITPEQPSEPEPKQQEPEEPPEEEVIDDLFDEEEPSTDSEPAKEEPPIETPEFEIPDEDKEPFEEPGTEPIIPKEKPEEEIPQDIPEAEPEPEPEEQEPPVEIPEDAEEIPPVEEPQEEVPIEEPPIEEIPEEPEESPIPDNAEEIPEEVNPEEIMDEVPEEEPEEPPEENPLPEEPEIIPEPEPDPMEMIPDEEITDNGEEGFGFEEVPELDPGNIPEDDSLPDELPEDEPDEEELIPEPEEYPPQKPVKLSYADQYKLKMMQLQKMKQMQQMQKQQTADDVTDAIDKAFEMPQEEVPGNNNQMNDEIPVIDDEELFDLGEEEPATEEQV